MTLTNELTSVFKDDRRIDESNFSGFQKGDKLKLYFKGDTFFENQIIANSNYQALPMKIIKRYSTWNKDVPRAIREVCVVEVLTTIDRAQYDVISDGSLFQCVNLPIVK